MSRRPEDRLKGGGRFDVGAVSDPAPAVVKRGPARPLDREAAALRRVAGLGVAPELVRIRPGTLTTGLVPGEARSLADLPPAAAERLGRTLRAVHEARRTATGGLPSWPSRARSLAAYRRRRALDALAASGRERGLAERVLAALPPLPAAGADPRPFRFLHGDLVESNVLWTPAPVLVDWEFWRMGDPAEDLAYLAELNAPPDRVLERILAGYGDPAVARRVDGWRVLCAMDAAFWYRESGDRDRAAALRMRILRAQR